MAEGDAVKNKSGVIIRLPLKRSGHWSASSENCDIEAWVDPDSDSLNIKLRYCGHHQFFETVPEACNYPQISGSEIAQIIEEQKEPNVSGGE